MSDPAYRSWASEKDMEQAFADYGEAITNQVSKANYSTYRRDFSDLTNDLSGRPGLRQKTLIGSVQILESQIIQKR